MAMARKKREAKPEVRKPRDVKPWQVKLDAAAAAYDKKPTRRRLAEWLWWAEKIWAELAARDTVDRKALVEVRRDIDSVVPGWKKLRKKLEAKTPAAKKKPKTATKTLPAAQKRRVRRKTRRST
jgi:hypothetical protein